jgi:hypothetical protein
MPEAPAPLQVARARRTDEDVVRFLEHGGPHRKRWRLAGRRAGGPAST